MEVGAVKQAFNNEVILLKKKVTQAKVQVIHKLTRKAKTLAEKKAPEHLKEKLKKKAESAVKEVLIIKKIKARDVAKFMITHTGEVKNYLNKPIVDTEKACARLVLHKALQDKYKFIRSRFSNVPIKDLFMSRQERLKLKKEARKEEKNKKKKKGGKVVSSDDWDVENVIDNDNDIAKNDSPDDKNDSHDDDIDTFDDNIDSSDNNNDSSAESNNENDSDTENQMETTNIGHESSSSDQEIDEDDDKDAEVGKFVKLMPPVNKPVEKNNHKAEAKSIDESVALPKIVIKPKSQKKQPDKKFKESKNKNLNEKLQNRKFKKDLKMHTEERKVVDPFFITESGGNYLSLAEPRQPDEIKEIHKHGNRRERRAATFGHSIPKRPGKDFRQNNFNKFQKDNAADRSNNDRFNNNNKFNNHSKFNDKNGDFNNRKYNYNDEYSHSDRNSKFNDKNAKLNNKFNKKDDSKMKEEKLHPSWEAKKKLSSILPFQGKKIVFNES